MLTAVVTVTATIVALGASLASTGRSGASGGSKPGPGGAALTPGAALAPPGAPRPGESIDGIACGRNEALDYHVHVHLAIFVHGRARSVPLGIGIGPPVQVAATPDGAFAAGGQCFSYLHTHAADGIIHVEAPSHSGFTLGQFFDVWGQRLDMQHVGPAAGHVTAFVGGRRFHGDPRAIRLARHANLQLDVGTVVPPRRFSFPSGL
jgi:hypothetical protein